MIFVDKLDLFLFYEKQASRQIYLNANVLNKQLKDLLNNDKIIYDNINYLNYIFNTLNEYKPRELLDAALDRYYQIPKTENSAEYKRLFTDFGTIKHWVGDEEEFEF